MSAWNLTEHEWEILQHKRLQLLQHWEFREKKKSRTPVCLTFSFGAGLLMRQHLEAFFSSSQSGVGRFIRKIPSQFSLCWLLEPEPGASPAPGEIYGSLKASNFAPCWGSEKDLGFWCFHRSCGWIQLFFFFDAPHTSERSSSCWVFFFCLALWFFFFFFLSFMWTRQCLMFFRALLLRNQLIFVVQFILKMWSYLLDEDNVHTR